jgi:hypothetical protein
MNKITISLFATILSTGVCAAQGSGSVQTSGSASQDTSVSAGKSGAQASSSTSASQSTSAAARNGQMQSGAQLQTGSTVQAELTKPIDVRKNKPGDEIIAKTTQDVRSKGHVIVPRGSKIIGHVTQAQARAKGQEESQLGIAFDHVILKDGTRMPVAFAIQAIARSEADAAASAEHDAMMAGNAGGTTMAAGNAGAQARGMGGVVGTSGSVVNTAGSAPGATLSTATRAGADVTGLSSNSQGAVGLPALNLSSAVSGSSRAGSVISSRSSNVRLDSGTRMILQVAAQ